MTSGTRRIGGGRHRRRGSGGALWVARLLAAAFLLAAVACALAANLTLTRLAIVFGVIGGALAAGPARGRYPSLQRELISAQTEIARLRRDAIPMVTLHETTVRSAQFPAHLLGGTGWPDSPTGGDGVGWPELADSQRHELSESHVVIDLVAAERQAAARQQAATAASV
jgi:HAMP domain-containing protein